MDYVWVEAKDGGREEVGWGKSLHEWSPGGD